MSNSIVSNFKKIGTKIKSIKHIEIIIALTAIMIMLLIYFSNSCGSDKKTVIQGNTSEYDYCSSTIIELESKLSKIDGVGEVSVLINWTTSTEYVPAYSGTNSGNSSIVTEGDNVYIVKEVYPLPEGVIIICDGGNNLMVKMKLISAVASYFGIEEYKINVLGKSN